MWCTVTFPLKCFLSHARLPTTTPVWRNVYPGAGEVIGRIVVHGPYICSIGRLPWFDQYPYRLPLTRGFSVS